MCALAVTRITMHRNLTQGFFAYLIEHKIYTRTDQRKGKFRSFLLASLKFPLGRARPLTDAKAAKKQLIGRLKVI